MPANTLPRRHRSRIRNGRARAAASQAGGLAHASNPGTVLALSTATAREVFWGLRYVASDVREWRARAASIPDPDLRAIALNAIDRKRGNINGAALFWVLPARRNRDLLRLLVTYELLADFLDDVSEAVVHLGMDYAIQLHRALIEALDPAVQISDYYGATPSHEDGGYLLALVESCRSGCRLLPSYDAVRPTLMQATALSPILALNHEPDAEQRDRALLKWAELNWPQPHTIVCSDCLTWFEQTAAASAWLTILALLALAAQPLPADTAEDYCQQTFETYLNWIAPASAMLDSYGDVVQDLATDHHSYIGHYPSTEVATDRVADLIAGSRSHAAELPAGSRHSVLVGCMIAFYLSKDSVRRPERLHHTRRLERAGGSLVRSLVPVLRLWRAAYGQRSA
jgi:tetraprenyl-beta-curcumene synthase